MEAEFFGYRKGAFTGAERDREGFFQAAAGGTLFLDEVAELPLAMQVKLLRAIQERRVRKVGASVEEPVDVRLVSATHQDLGALVTAGRFRQDLFYRLNVIELRVPGLRERLDDIPLLAESILMRISERAGSRRAHLSPSASAALKRYQLSRQRARAGKYSGARSRARQRRCTDGGRSDAARRGARRADRRGTDFD